MTFGELHERLIRLVKYRISNGDFTERGLARMLRISQPHLHNVLKGARKLTPSLADHLLQSFGMTVVDLLDSSELKSPSRLRDEGAARVPISVEREIPKKHPVRASFPAELVSKKSA